MPSPFANRHSVQFDLNWELADLRKMVHTNESIGNRRRRLPFFFSEDKKNNNRNTKQQKYPILQSHLIHYILHYARAQTTKIVQAIVCLAAATDAIATSTKTEMGQMLLKAAQNEHRERTTEQ